MHKPKFSNNLIVEFIKELTANQIVTWVQFIFCYPDQTEQDRIETVELMQEINDKCNSPFVRHFWYKFVVHYGTEDFFQAQYGVLADSSQNWHNLLYNPSIIEQIAQTYRRKIPKNGAIFL